MEGRKQKVQAPTPAEVGGLVERLQERATVMETLSPDFTSVCREAATALEAQAVELAAERAALRLAAARADRAEAALAEALKALNYLNDAVAVGLPDQEISRRARLLVSARRALEGGEG